MEIEKVFDILLKEHRNYCKIMFQKCESSNDFKEFAVRADTVRVMINKVLNGYSDTEFRQKYKEKLQKKIDNVCEEIFFKSDEETG
jgi:hypothetical protein